MMIPYRGSMPRGGERPYGGTPTFGVWNKQDGRFIVGIRGHTYKVARLVAEAFHGSAPFENAVVMHLDENAANNRADNLGWGTQKENLNAPGASFVPLGFAESTQLPKPGAKPGASAPNRFYMYGVIGRLAMLAAAYEMEATDPDAEIYE